MVSSGTSTLGSALLGTAPMTPMMTLTCWIFGALTLVVNVVIKQIPHDKFISVEKMDIEGIGKKQIIIDKMSDKLDDMFHKVNKKMSAKGEIE